MDKPKTIKTLSRQRRRLIWMAGILLVMVILGAYATTIQPADYALKRSQIRINDVRNGDMTIEVRGNGIFAPKYVRQVSAYADGRVESVRVKPGASVHPGDIIARLSNPGLQQQAEAARWASEAAKAEHSALKMKQQSKMLDAQARVLQVRHQLEKTRLQFDAQSKLLKRNNGSVSQIDYDRTRLDLEQFKEQLAIEQQRLNKLQQTQQSELAADLAKVNQIKNALVQKQNLVRSLTIQATEQGVIQTVNIEAGQQIPRGFNVARLAQRENLIAELQIPERQVRQVMPGQSVIINTHNHMIPGEVTRIDPAVSQGTVQVDVAFTAPLPPEARPDLSIEGTITVSALKNTLYVTRPALAQSNSPGTVFKLSADGKTATRVRVMYGKASADTIQITRGLRVNDRIITSNPQAWAHANTVSIE